MSATPIERPAATSPLPLQTPASSSVPQEPPRDRPSLRRELLINLGVLVAAALSLAIGTALLVQLLDPRYAAAALVFLVAADVAIIFVFGRHLLDRLVLQPMASLTAAAEALAMGDFARRAPDAETRDFSELADRFNHVTERLLDAQSQIVRTEKLASIGRLAAGVAHEIGNPLSAVGTYVEVLKKKGVDRDIVAALEREAGRIDRIVRELLQYARPGDEPLGVVNLGLVIDTVQAMLEHQGVLKGVTLLDQCAESLPLVRGKVHAFEQVVVNLVLNAVDAVPGGRVVVGAERWRYEIPGEQPRRRSDAALTGPVVDRRPERPSRAARRPWRSEIPVGTPGVLLFVADSGPGVPPEDRERVFDPFFTTKPPGQGTGLGLAIVQRTVHEFGGVVWVEAAREGGAAFKVFMPAAGP